MTQMAFFEITERECRRCHTVQPADEFYRNRGKLTSWCRTCTTYLALEWRRNNPEKFYRARRLRLLKKYGMDEGQYEAMYAAQEGKCGACGTDEPGGMWNSLNIDHDHDTGKVRGLLCIGCNVALGHARDDPKRLRALAAYLEEAAA